MDQLIRLGSSRVTVRLESAVRVGVELLGVRGSSRHLLDLEAVDEFFLCGPEAMISEVSRGLRDGGIDEAKIHYELFGASAADAAAAVAKHHERARKFGGRLCGVTVKADGREIRLELSTDGENVLDAALDAGVDLPFACKGGACATCKAT